MEKDLCRLCGLILCEPFLGALWRWVAFGNSIMLHTQSDTPSKTVRPAAKAGSMCARSGCFVALQLKYENRSRFRPRQHTPLSFHPSLSTGSDLTGGNAVQ